MSSVQEWIAEGIEAGYCELRCGVHNGPIFTDETLLAFDQGYDDCAPILALTTVAQKLLEIPEGDA